MHPTHGNASVAPSRSGQLRIPALEGAGATNPSFFRVQKTGCFPLKRNAGQLTRSKGTGIDADAVLFDFRHGYDRMPMDNHLVETFFRYKKVPAYPKNILFLLARKRNPRPNPGMHEKIVAFRMHKRKALIEFKVPWGETCPEFFLGALQCLRFHARSLDRYPVAVQRGAAAISHPCPTGPGIGKKIKKCPFMIPHEIKTLKIRERVSDQMFDRFPRLRAAVDIVAKIDKRLAHTRKILRVFNNEEMQFLQEIEPAMYVPDRINAAPFGDTRHLNCQLVLGR
jgi:hypothetical protein